MARTVKNKPCYDLFIPFAIPPAKEREVEHTLMRGNKVVKRWRTTPEKTVENIRIIQRKVLHLFGDTDANNVFKLKVIALFKRPQRLIKVDTESIILVGVKPDWDNIGKIVSDAFNKLLWKDDAQVADSRVVKRYVKIKNGEWEQPGIKIKIWRIGRKR